MFKTYVVFSLGTAIGAVHNSMNLNKQFYPTVLYLSTNKINRTIFINLALMLVSTFIAMFIKLMFGEIREIEKISVIDKTKRKILEVAYLLFFFTEELDWQFMFLMIGLIGLSVIHWVTRKRASYLIAESQLRLLPHAKLIVCFILLFYIDVKVSLFFFKSSESKFQNILFGFEFLLLPIRLGLPFIKYFVNLFEIGTYSHFENKQTLFSALDLLSTMAKLVVQFTLVKFVWNTHGFFLYLFVETFENFCAMVKQFRAFHNQLKLVYMIEKIEDVDEVDKNDNICLICLHTIENGKKLSCNHVYHKNCLKSWIQGNPNQFCPKCKKPISLESEDYQEENKKIKKMIVNQELIEIRTNMTLLNIVSKYRALQYQVQSSEGIGSVAYGLPCEAVYQTTPITEMRRLQINQMNSILLGIEEGQFEAPEL